MVKVIKYGKRRVTCNECDSVLEFEKKDISSRQTGINEYEKFVRCPVCTNAIVIPFQMCE